jgi:hypothetical protein
MMYNLSNKYLHASRYVFRKPEVVLGVSTFCFGQDEITLRKELDILESIIGKTWLCEEKSPDGQRIFHFLLTFKSILNGNNIKRYLSQLCGLCAHFASFSVTKEFSEWTHIWNVKN